jgi:uncharacterized protein YaaW (UPF0174 family)
MAIKMRDDKYLEFLETQENENLDVLVKILTRGEDGDKRISQELLDEERYKNYYPNHQKYWDLIAAEYQLFGGNTWINLFRGYGVEYEEILTDVCKKMKVNLPDKASIETKESNLLQKVIEGALDKMTPDKRKEFVRDLNIKTTDFSKQAIMIAILVAIRQSGFMAYQLSVVIANVIAKQVLGHGLKFATNAGITRLLGTLAGPIGWAVTAIWTAIDTAGPALRVTIPATIYIAALRQAELNKQSFDIKCPHCKAQLVVNDAKFCPSCGGAL